MDEERFTWIKTEKAHLRNLASKINNIPKEFCKIDGSLDLDKIHLKLIDYHRRGKS